MWLDHRPPCHEIGCCLSALSAVEWRQVATDFSQVMSLYAALRSCPARVGVKSLDPDVWTQVIVITGERYQDFSSHT